MFKIIIRIILDIIIVLCIIHGWWYFALLLGIVGVWNFGFYIELIIAGLFYDSLFSPSIKSGVAGSLGLIVSIVAFVIMIIIKRVVRIKE